jgi:hypothetical protein
MNDETKITLLGVIATEPDEALAFTFPADLDPDAIKTAIEKANAERAEAQARETAKLREMFLKAERHD